MTESMLPIGWWHQPFLVFDVESTGVNVFEDRIVQAGLGVAHDPAVEVRLWPVVNPGIEIPAGSTQVHGITTEQAQAEGQDAAQALDEMLQALHRGMAQGMPLVAFNACFDLTMLHHECLRHGLPTLSELLETAEPRPIVDPFVIDGKMSKRRGLRKLEAQCEYYNIPPAGQLHNAAIDAVQTARLVPVLMETYPELAQWTLPALHDQQRVWAGQRARSLRSHFLRSGQADRAAGVVEDWPIATQEKA